jgi:Domain of unknown function (DUF1772)
MPGFRFVAILSAVLFSGAAIYINLVEHPARMECGTRLASTVFGPSYRRAAVLQVILALLATIGGAGAWLTGAPRAWLLGAFFIVAVIPFTLLVIRPTNRLLLDPKAERTAEATNHLLRKWGRLHAVRSILGLLASLTFVCSVI